MVQVQTSSKECDAILTLNNSKNCIVQEWQHALQTKLF